MSNLIGPYYQFNSGSTLMADHLNQMQQNIANLPTVIEYDFEKQGIPENTIYFPGFGEVLPPMTFYQISEQIFTPDDINFHTFFYSNYAGERNAYLPFYLEDSVSYLKTDTLFSYGEFSTPNAGNYLIAFAQQDGTQTIAIADGVNITLEIPAPGIYVPFDGDLESSLWYTKISIYKEDLVVLTCNDSIVLGQEIELPLENAQVFSQHSLNDLLIQGKGKLLLTLPTGPTVILPLSAATFVSANTEGTWYNITSPIYPLPEYAEPGKLASLTFATISITFIHDAISIIFCGTQGLVD